METQSDRATAIVSAVEVHGKLIERLPRNLRERAWKLADMTTSVERRHNEALRLIHDALIHLASLAFADYRRLRLHDPDPAVEKVLLKFDRPWLKDHLDLLVCSLKAVPKDEALLQTRQIKLQHGDRLRRAIEALEQAVASDARRVGVSLERTLDQTSHRKMPVFKFLDLVIAYRNGALGHQERTNWTDLLDFYDCLTPVLDQVAAEFVFHDDIHEALTRRPLGTLTHTEPGPDGQVVHKCLVDHHGRYDQRRTIVSTERATETWNDSRWNISVGSRLLLDTNDDDLRILAPFHDFASSAHAPQPLVWPGELDRQTAVVREVLQQTWAYNRDQRSTRFVDASAIAARVGLSSPDVTAILASLGSVLEGLAPGGATTSSATSWESAALRHGLGYVLAVELGHEDFAITFSDLDGLSPVSEPFRERERYQEIMDDPHEVMRFTASQADRLRLEAGIEPQLVFAVVVSVAACVQSDDPTDPVLPHCIAPGSGFPKRWDGFSPAIELERALHLQVDWDPQAAVGNDANLAALAESTWGAGKGSRGLIYVEWSEGIGGGLVFDGELFAGAHGGAAEFGHYRVEVSAPYPCSSGHLNCLEAVASTTSMLKQANDQSGADGPENFADLWELVRAGKHRYTHIVAVAASHVGATLAPIVAALDPDRIVIGGPFKGDETDRDILGPPLLGGIEKRLPSGYRQPELRMSKLSENAVLQGAVTYGLQAFGPDYLVATAKRALADAPRHPS